jgi:hypothetical protein
VRTLRQRDLNRALLARQLLLERGRSSLPRTLDRLAGIQAQYAPSMYIGLFCRLDGFERESLTRALERRSVVQGTLHRQTIHLVSKADYWPIALAIREARRRAWNRPDWPDKSKVAAAAKKLRERIAEGPMQRKEIDELLGGGSVLTNAVGLWLDLVRVPPSGTWERRRADLYAAAEDWLGPSRGTAAEGVELLIRRYLGGFCPASPREIADWAGLPAKQVAAAIEAMKLRRFRAEDGAELVDLPRAPLPDAETPAPARFLPVWDATLLVHARRTQILPEEIRPKIFNARTPHSVNTFLVDGQVAGTWKHEKGRIDLSPFSRLDASDRRELESEAERLADFHG